MIKYTPFSYFNPSEIAEIRTCLCNTTKLYKKGDIIMQYPGYSDFLCIVDAGTAHLVRIDINGQKSIIDYYESSDVFGSIIAPDSTMDTLYIIAKDNCTVTFIDYKKLLTRCDKNCDKHMRFMNNLIVTAIKKSQMHIDILSQRTIRAKLFAYFKYLSVNGGDSIKLPLSLSDLADYLSADRSAMMREIKKMNSEGLIESTGNRIKLKNNGYDF